MLCFQADNLPAERFHGEMQAAAVSAGGLMQATKSRVFALLR